MKSFFSYSFFKFNREKTSVLNSASFTVLNARRKMILAVKDKYQGIVNVLLKKKLYSLLIIFKFEEVNIQYFFLSLFFLKKVSINRTVL